MMRNLADAVSAGLKRNKEFTFKDPVPRDLDGSGKAVVGEVPIGIVFTYARFDPETNTIVLRERDGAGDEGHGKFIRSATWFATHLGSGLKWKGLRLGDPENVYPDVIKNFLDALDAQGYFDDRHGNTTYNSSHYDFDTTFWWRNGVIKLSEAGQKAMEELKNPPI